MVSNPYRLFLLNGRAPRCFPFLVVQRFVVQWDECPDWERIAAYKSEAVNVFAATANERPFGPPMYVESCSRQAARIAESSGVMVVCPASGEVLGPEGCWL